MSFAKEHREIKQQKKQIDALTASLQKISAQLAAASPSLADLKRANLRRKWCACPP